MDPYYEDEWVTLYHGDYRSVELPTVDAVVTDPPYGTFPLEKGPNGDLADPSVLHMGNAFRVSWAFVDEQPKCYLYEVYDRHRRLVYVGITDWFPARWSSHLRSSWWATSVDIQVVLLYGFASRFDARLVEALTIAEHRPPCNVNTERKYLGIAQRVGRPDDVFIAELQPTRKS